ncbi:hypothetical protein [Marinobacterium marinum]|uniref:Glutaredoxin domain-containing protein n=1 Tax=Marinobacterium marinum TaxID=2756129 RepID=A0A7W1WYS5_9GAMM|nr:hypothetical protein [Marinobacterium marinum]MBA4502537.1 hypothetical protein [Marinobacterium marinum]
MTVNKIILFAIIAFGSFQLWEKHRGNEIKPLYEEPYVAVYGRDSCSITRKMVADLAASGIKYEYFVVDEKATADVLHSRMEAAGIATRRYDLPVVDTNGSIQVRPAFYDVVKQYNAGL